MILSTVQVLASEELYLLLIQLIFHAAREEIKKWACSLQRLKSYPHTRKALFYFLFFISNWSPYSLAEFFSREIRRNLVKIIKQIIIDQKYNIFISSQRCGLAQLMKSSKEHRQRQRAYCFPPKTKGRCALVGPQKFFKM